MMITAAAPFLMFTGRCEEALTFYAETVPDTRVLSLDHHGEGGSGQPGKVAMARFSVAGQVFRAFDSPPVHDFGFTPSFSIFLDADDPDDIDKLSASLGQCGKTLMPPDAYGFSRRFAWVQDRFGVSWQINAA